MITLSIKTGKGAIYGTEYFNDRASCDKWLALEKTRPYWKKDFTTEIIETVQKNPEPIDTSKKDVSAAALSAFDKSKMQPGDAGVMIEHIAVMLGLK